MEPDLFDHRFSLFELCAHGIKAFPQSLTVQLLLELSRKNCATLVVSVIILDDSRENHSFLCGEAERLDSSERDLDMILELLVVLNNWGKAIELLALLPMATQEEEYSQKELLIDVAEQL